MAVQHVEITDLIPKLDSDKFLIDISSVSSKTSNIEYIKHHETGEDVRAYHKTTGSLRLVAISCDNGDELVSEVEKIIHEYGGYFFVDQHSAPILGHREGDICLRITNKSIENITPVTLEVGLEVRVLETDEFLKVVSDKLKAYYLAHKDDN